MLRSAWNRWTTHRRQKQHAARIERPEIEHDVEVLLPQVARRRADDCVAVRSVAEFEGVRLERVRAHLRD